MIQLKLTKRRSNVPCDNVTRDTLVDGLSNFEEKFEQTPNRLVIDRRTAKQLLKFSCNEIGSAKHAELFYDSVNGCIDNNGNASTRLFGHRLTIQTAPAAEPFCYWAYDSALAKKLEKVQAVNALILRDILIGDDGAWVQEHELTSVRVLGYSWDSRARALPLWDNDLGILKTLVRHQIGLGINRTPLQMFKTILSHRDSVKASDAAMMPCELDECEENMYVYMFADRLS